MLTEDEGRPCALDRKILDDLAYRINQAGLSYPLLGFGGNSNSATSSGEIADGAISKPLHRIALRLWNNVRMNLERRAYIGVSHLCLQHGYGFALR